MSAIVRRVRGRMLGDGEAGPEGLMVFGQPDGSRWVYEEQVIICRTCPLCTVEESGS